MSTARVVLPRPVGAVTSTMVMSTRFRISALSPGPGRGSPRTWRTAGRSSPCSQRTQTPTAARTAVRPPSAASVEQQRLRNGIRDADRAGEYEKDDEQVGLEGEVAGHAVLDV